MRAAAGPRSRWLVAITTAGALLAGPAAAPAAGQEQPQDISSFLGTLATLWTRGDATGLVAHGARSGLDLEVHGAIMGPLQGRRAAAALRQLFSGQETVAVEPGSGTRVAGVEDRAFGEFTWVVRSPGSVITEHNKIFVALVREEGRWRVSQIRILR